MCLGEIMNSEITKEISKIIGRKNETTLSVEKLADKLINELCVEKNEDKTNKVQ